MAGSEPGLEPGWRVGNGVRPRDAQKLEAFGLRRLEKAVLERLAV
jgi:hypothetical protein